MASRTSLKRTLSPINLFTISSLQQNLASLYYGVSLNAIKTDVCKKTPRFKAFPSQESSSKALF